MLLWHLLLHLFLVFASILTGLNFLVTIHRLRAPGMTFFKMPLFVWGIYATAWIQLLATPVVGITLVLAILEKYFGIGIFDPAKGGRPGIVPTLILDLLSPGSLSYDSSSIWYYV